MQVQKNDGSWVGVTSLPEQIVVNVGDMLQRLTNNRLRSTTHRVVNPPKEKWGSSRFSIPFFLHPRSNMDLTCLESCVTPAHPKAYEGRNSRRISGRAAAGDWLEEIILGPGNNFFLRLYKPIC